MCLDMHIGTGKLNKDQRIAVEMAFAKDNKLLLVQGPPGKLRVYIILYEFTCVICRYWQEHALCGNDKTIC